MHVSHGWSEESPESKAAWLRSLSVEERMDVFVEFMDMILELNPRLLEEKLNVEPVPGRVQVLNFPKFGETLAPVAASRVT